MSDDESARLLELRNLKRRRLHELDKRVARSGMDAPPDVQIERAELRQELGMVEQAIGSPLSPQFVEELGQSARYISYHAELRRANDGIALLGERLDAFVADSMEWRRMHRQWIVLIGIVVVVTLVVVAVVVTVVFLRGV